MTKSEKPASKPATESDPAAEELQAQADQEAAQGFRGVETDPTPNENYTVSGVTSGAPTPETDDDAAEDARKAQADVSKKTYGVAER